MEPKQNQTGLTKGIDQLRADIREALIIMGKALAEESQKFGELPPMTLKDVHMYRDAYRILTR